MLLLHNQTSENLSNRVKKTHPDGETSKPLKSMIILETVSLLSVKSVFPSQV